MDYNSGVSGDPQQLKFQFGEQYMRNNSGAQIAGGDFRDF